MKFLIIVTLILLSVYSNEQVPILAKANKWQLYNIADENAFTYSLDTLNNFSYINLAEDSLKYFLEGLNELPDHQPQFWQGAYIATYQLDGMRNKIEISHYGGLLFDETRKRHYQIAEYKID